MVNINAATFVKNNHLIDQAIPNKTSALPIAVSKRLSQNLVKKNDADTDALINKILVDIQLHADQAFQAFNNKAKDENIVPFMQWRVTGDPILSPELRKINKRFSGLCEIICNKILMDNLLGKGTLDSDFLEKEITATTLNQGSIKKSHLLQVYSIFRRLAAFLFGVYPNNLFSTKEQWKLVKKQKNVQGKKVRKINQDLLVKGLDKIETGTTLKLEVFKRTLKSFSGHAMLIKKMGEDDFIFFDPNEGEKRGLTKENMEAEINKQIGRFNGTDIFLFRGDTYLDILKRKKITTGVPLSRL